MTSEINELLMGRVTVVHNWLLGVTKPLTDAEFSHRFGPTAPPIGWHLWHMARWADRLQAKLTAVTAGKVEKEIWVKDDLVSLWQLDPERLGVYETGMRQEFDKAAAVVDRAGRQAIQTYAGQVFAACNARVGGLSPGILGRAYPGIQDYAYDPASDTVSEVPGKETTVASDLLFHAIHGSRHAGMIEGLRGLWERPGTASV